MLIVQHRSDGKWNIPAGGVEQGETDVAAAQRELAEETSLSASECVVTDLALQRTYPRALDTSPRHMYPPGIETVVITFFSVEAPSQWEPVLSDEHKSHRWVSRAEAIASVDWDLPQEALRIVSKAQRR